MVFLKCTLEEGLEGFQHVLDCTQPSGDGEPPWSNDPDERFAFDPNFDEFGDHTQRAIQTLSILDGLSPIDPMFNHHGQPKMVLGPTNMLPIMTPLTMKSAGLILVGLMLILFRKPWNSPPNGVSPYLIHSL